MIAALFLAVPALILVGGAALMLVHIHRRDLRAEWEFDAVLEGHGWSTETSAVTVLRAVPVDEPDDLDVPSWMRSVHPSTGEAS